MIQLTLSEIAGHTDGRVLGNPERVVSNIRALGDATKADISFLSNPRYRRDLKSTRAGALLVTDPADLGGRDGVVVADAALAMAQVLELFHPSTTPTSGISRLAFVHESAQVAEDVCVEAFVSIGEGAQVASGCWLQAGAVVGKGSRLGEGCRLMPNAVVMDGCVLGARVWMNPGAVVGGEGFGFVQTTEGLRKVPQASGVEIGSDVEVGSNSCIDRGALRNTVVGGGSKLDNFVQLGHGAQLGDGSVLVAYSGVAGSSRLGDRVTLAARSSVLGHLEVGSGVKVAAHSMVTKDTAADAVVSGVPAQDHRAWLREQALLRKLEEMESRIRALEAEKT